MSQSFDVIVIGGGIVGMCAAIAMSQRGFSVALIDAGTMTVDTSIPDVRVYAINHASQSLLQTLGAWALIDPTRLSPYEHMVVWDAVNGAHIEFDARMQGISCLGTILEESILKDALLKQLSKERIVSFPKHQVTSVYSMPDGITISDGTSHWDAKLLMVADGATSAVREQLGVSLTSWSYHQKAIVTTVHTERSHHHTAYQVFNPDGPLAFLPLADRHHCSIVWSTSPEHADALMNLTDDAFAAELKNAFAAKLGDCSVIAKRYLFPLQMRHAKSYSGAHWLLMGDAAHTIHPLAGLGLNVGLADVTAWCHYMGKEKQQAWSNKALGAYQRQRKYEVWQTIALMESLKSIFAQSSPSFAVLRGLGLGACNQLLPLKRWFISQATD